MICSVWYLSWTLFQIEKAFDDQKVFEKQRLLEDEARREKDRLEELKRKEQERILEVSLFYKSLILLKLNH